MEVEGEEGGAAEAGGEGVHLGKEKGREGFK